MYSFRASSVLHSVAVLPQKKAKTTKPDVAVGLKVCVLIMSYGFIAYSAGEGVVVHVGVIAVMKPPPI